MKSEEIYKALHAKYFDQKYLLQNSYVFRWESDFFFKTVAGLYIEVEVKTSKADFKRDFTKQEKHESINRAFTGIKKFVKKTYNNYIVEYDEVKTVLPREFDLSTNKYKTRPTGVRVKQKIQMTEDSIENYVKKLLNPVLNQLDCGIQISTNSICPNKFYYACPEGMISKDEVPKYSGLIYVKDGKCNIVKRAPQIHKERLKIENVLLDKFYYKSLKLEQQLKNYEQ